MRNTMLESVLFLLSAVPTVAQAQFTFVSEQRIVQASASCTGNGSSDSDPVLTRTGPGGGALWNTNNSALANAVVSVAGCGASSVQLSEVRFDRVAMQGSTSLSASIGNNVTGGRVQANGLSRCVFAVALPANQRIQILSSLGDGGSLALINVSTGATLFSGEGIETLVFPTPTIIRIEAQAIGQIDSTASPTQATSGGVYAVTILNLDAPPPPPTCDAIDFNNDGLFPSDDDLIDFFSVFAGGPCSSSSCNDIDFNNDGLFPDDADLAAFLRVLAGGAC